MNSNEIKGFSVYKQTQVFRAVILHHLRKVTTSQCHACIYLKTKTYAFYACLCAENITSFETELSFSY